MARPPIRIAVTGATGRIGYDLALYLAEGQMLGRNQPIILQMLAQPSEDAQRRLKGVMMDLEDCASPLLAGMVGTGDPKVAFKDADYAFLVGARPRGPHMERRDLLNENAKIFIEQGRALNEAASRDVRVLTVGNPANTNGWLAMKSAPDLPKANFSSLMRLDYSRARFKLAEKTGKLVRSVHKLAVWGNHSPSVYPDIRFATIDGIPAVDLVDRDWYENEYIPGIAARGAAIIEARGTSSVGPAAIAAIKHMRDWALGTGDRWVSMAIPSDGSYGIPEDMMYGVPVTCKPGKYERVRDLDIDAFSRKKMDISIKELLEEQGGVEDLLKNTASAVHCRLC